MSILATRGLERIGLLDMVLSSSFHFLSVITSWEATRTALHFRVTYKLGWHRNHSNIGLGQGGVSICAILTVFLTWSLDYIFDNNSRGWKQPFEFALVLHSKQFFGMYWTEASFLLWPLPDKRNQYFQLIFPRMLRSQDFITKQKGESRTWLEMDGCWTDTVPNQLGEHIYRHQKPQRLETETNNRDFCSLFPNVQAVQIEILMNMNTSQEVLCT